MSLHNAFVAVYAHRGLAEIDLEKMQNSGFDMSRLRVIAHDPPHIAERRQIEHALHSFGELELEFFECIPEEDIVDYESELETGHFFIVAHGLPDEIEQAKRIAESSHHPGWDGLADATIYYGCRRSHQSQAIFSF
jgi:hypothetical protein